MQDKSTKISVVVLIGVFALACSAVGVLLNSLRIKLTQTPSILQTEALEYPDTGLHLPQPRDPHVVQANSLTTTPPVFALAYEDVVHPDEDLLRPQGPSLQQTPSFSAQDADPPAVTPPATQPPNTTDLEPVTQPVQPPAYHPPQTTSPPPADPRPPSASTAPSDDLEMAPNWQSGERAYDMNAGPAPDEDLLRPGQTPTGPPLGTTQEPAERLPVEPDAPDTRTPSTDQQPATPPIEVLPDRPAPVPDQRQPAEPPFAPPPQPGGVPGLVPYAPHSTGGPPAAEYTGQGDPHAEVFAKTLFPSAKECRACHETIYEEWASSSHAYAAISPMFQKFEQAINTLAKGTLGYFCMRCHAPVATTLSLPREAPIYTSIPAGVEGVTCVACHRVVEEYGKVNGERRIEPGSIHDPVLGAGYGEGLAEVLAKKDYFKVKTGPQEKGAGLDIHNRVIHFEQLSSSHFCVSCHQVAVYPGIKLEVVWEQYRASPAHKQGISCQDCHMGQEPGVADGYTTGPVAVVNDKEISPHRKHSNHMFYGPGYSIAHPGTFPFNADAEDWHMEEWLQFDYRAGWGTEAFEDLVADKRIRVAFPKVWASSDDRMDAREIVDANLKKLEAKRAMRHRLMENGSCLQGPVFKRQPRIGKPLHFHYVVQNKNLGHNMPSGSLGAQPQIWLNVALTGPTGQHLWESGHVDANGDLADLHSLEVAAGRIRRDLQLFNLQTKFLITHVKGTDREFFLPVNVDFDQLPFIRPSAFPISVMNHPPFIRMEGHSLAPLGSRNATYKVPAHLIAMPGQYRLSVRMRSRAEPIYFMRFCNATPEMERNMNEWMLDFHEDHFDFYVAP